MSREFTNKLGKIVIEDGIINLCIGYTFGEKKKAILKIKYIDENYDVKVDEYWYKDITDEVLNRYNYTSHMFNSVLFQMKNYSPKVYTYRYGHYNGRRTYDVDLYSYKQVLKIYYYNEQGNLAEMEYHEPARESLKRLKVGDNLIVKLPEILDKYKDYNKRRELLVDEAIARVTVLKPRFVRAQPKTFDYVYVDLSLPSDLANTDYVKENKAKLDALVLDKLDNYDPFLKYGIPDNFLRIERITLTRDNLLEYVIGLKENVIE